jgi:hypothetical protein
MGQESRVLLSDCSRMVFSQKFKLGLVPASRLSPGSFVFAWEKPPRYLSNWPGHWSMRVEMADVDWLWDVISVATGRGQLGPVSSCSIPVEFPGAAEIRVYTECALLVKDVRNVRKVFASLTRREPDSYCIRGRFLTYESELFGDFHAST